MKRTLFICLHKKNFVALAFSLIFLAIVSAAEAKMVSASVEKLNLRSGPGTKYAVQWEYGKGFPLRVLKTKGNWYRVQDYENDVGWVHRGLVNRVPHMIVKKKKVNIRSGPGSRYKIKGKAEYGVVFKTIKQQKGWAEVEHESGLVGWVRRDLIWGW